MMINGNRIKRLREQKGWSLKELALALKLSEPDIYQAETNGKGLSAPVVNRLKVWADEQEKHKNDPINQARKEIAAMKEEVIQEIMGVIAPIQNEEKNIFGDKIRKIREEKGVSRSKMGAILGVTPLTIRNWELGVGFPGPKNLKKLAAFLDVKVSVLKNLKDKKKSTITIELEQHDYERFNAICTSLSTTPSEMVRRMVRKWV